MELTTSISRFSGVYALRVLALVVVRGAWLAIGLLACLFVLDVLFGLSAATRSRFVSVLFIRFMELTVPLWGAPILIHSAHSGAPLVELPELGSARVFGETVRVRVAPVERQLGPDRLKLLDDMSRPEAIAGFRKMDAVDGLRVA